MFCCSSRVSSFIVWILRLKRRSFINMYAWETSHLSIAFLFFYCLLINSSFNRFWFFLATNHHYYRHQFIKKKKNIHRCIAMSQAYLYTHFHRLKIYIYKIYSLWCLNVVFSCDNMYRASAWCLLSEWVIDYCTVVFLYSIS